MTEVDHVLAHVRRLYYHYNKMTPPNRQYAKVAEDFESIVENLEYLQTKLYDMSHN